MEWLVVIQCESSKGVFETFFPATSNKSINDLSALPLSFWQDYLNKGELVITPAKVVGAKIEELDRSRIFCHLKNGPNPFPVHHIEL